LKRRVGKQSISRRYDLIPLLRSSPGGFKGSWPYRTYPFLRREITTFFLTCQIFLSQKHFCRRNHFGGRRKEMAFIRKTEQEKLRIRN
ncbi:MAG: hypothetical protein IKJ92_05340, partial [Bacteroidaceae bacterium]|nr:hypothetical protein [Bacteroidaceae bacterium]